MERKKLKIVKYTDKLQKSSSNFFEKKVTIAIKQKALENKDEKFLKLSNVLHDWEEQGYFFWSKKHFIHNENDRNLLLKIEKFINLAADERKIVAFENFIENNKAFPDYESLKNQLKQKEKVLEGDKNNYYLKYNNFYLENIFFNLPIPPAVINEIETLILRMFNFLAKKMSIEQLCKILLSIGVTNDTSKENFTYFFPNVNMIVTVLNSEWWDKTKYAAEQWTCVYKNGTGFIHEMGHALDFFSRHDTTDFFLVNSLNIKEIYESKTGEKWTFSEPIEATVLKNLAKKITTKEFACKVSDIDMFSYKFADYVFKKTIDLLNRNKEQTENDYSYNQDVRIYFMIICTLIPSNYVRKTAVSAKYVVDQSSHRAFAELFSEAFSFLISANDEDKNIFWEWIYDFVMEKWSW